jgi:hypothetical protein
MCNNMPRGTYSFERKEDPKPASRPRTSELPPSSRRDILERRLAVLRFRRIVTHPDKGGSHEEFIRANAEYEAAKREL